MNYILKSFGYTVGCVCCLMSTYEFFSNSPFDMSKYSYTIKNMIAISTLIFIILLMLFIIISFLLKSIQNLFLGFYYGLFYNPKHDKMYIKIDQDDIIRESFMELKNGEKIPIFISRIVTHQPESTTGENNE